MGNNILKGKKGIIFGALDSSSIAWKTAERVHNEGGEFILTNAPVSIRMGSINDLAKKNKIWGYPSWCNKYRGSWELNKFNNK